jgi:Flp pilus assembly pilin Flp
VGLIAVVIMGSLSLLGGGADGMWTGIGTGVGNAIDGALGN